MLGFEPIYHGKLVVLTTDYLNGNFYIFTAYGKAIEVPASGNRNAEIVAHMTRMSIETFKEEDDIIRREISGGSDGISSGKGHGHPKHLDRPDNRNYPVSRGAGRRPTTNGRRTIRIDEIEVVAGGGEGINQKLLRSIYEL